MQKRVYTFGKPQQYLFGEKRYLLIHDIDEISGLSFQEKGENKKIVSTYLQYEQNIQEDVLQKIKSGVRLDQLVLEYGSSRISPLLSHQIENIQYIEFYESSCLYSILREGKNSFDQLTQEQQQFLSALSPKNAYKYLSELQDLKSYIGLISQISPEQKWYQGFMSQLSSEDISLFFLDSRLSKKEQSVLVDIQFFAHETVSRNAIKESKKQKFGVSLELGEVFMKTTFTKEEEQSKVEGMISTIVQFLGTDVANRASQEARKKGGDIAQNILTYISKDIFPQQIENIKKKNIPQFVDIIHRDSRFFIELAKKAGLQKLIPTIQKEYTDWIDIINATKSKSIVDYAVKLEGIGVLEKEQAQMVFTIDQSLSSFNTYLISFSGSFLKYRDTLYHFREECAGLNRDEIKKKPQYQSFLKGEYAVSSIDLDAFLFQNGTDIPLHKFLKVHQFCDQYAIPKNKMKEYLMTPTLFVYSSIDKSTLEKISGIKIEDKIYEFFRYGSANFLTGAFQNIHDSLCSSRYSILEEIDHHTSKYERKENADTIRDQNTNPQEIYHQMIRIQKKMTEVREFLENNYSNLNPDAKKRVDLYKEVLEKLKQQNNDSSVLSSIERLVASILQKSDFTNHPDMALEAFQKKGVSGVYEKNILQIDKVFYELSKSQKEGRLSEYITENFPSSTLPEKSKKIEMRVNQSEKERQFNTSLQEICFEILQENSFSKAHLFLKKPDGSPFFLVLNDSDFETIKGARDSQGMMFDIDSFEFIVRQSLVDEWMNEAGETIDNQYKLRIMHELSHAISRKTSFVQDFENFLKDIGGEGFYKEVEKNIQEIWEDREDSHVSLMEELAASMMGGVKNPSLATLISKINTTAKEQGKSFQEDVLLPNVNKLGGVVDQLQKKISKEKRAVAENEGKQLTEDGFVEDVSKDKIQMIIDGIHFLKEEYDKRLDKILEEGGREGAVKKRAEEIREIMNHGIEYAKKKGDIDSLLKIQEELGNKAEGYEAEEISKLEKYISQSGYKSSGYFQNLWKSTSILSMMDLQKIFKEAWSYLGEEIENKSDRRSAKAGAALTSGGLKNRFINKEASKISSAINDKKEWASQLSESDMYGALSGSSDQDEIRGILEALADIGGIDWENRIIHKALARINPRVDIYESDINNSNTLYSKLQSSMRGLWDPDTFSNLYNKNMSNIDSKVSEYAKETKLMGGNVKKQINTMLENHVKWKNSGGKHGAMADSKKYEAFVNNMREAGRGASEEFFYYLLLGVSRGLIKTDRAIGMAGESNSYPPLDLIGATEPSLEQYQRWEKEYRKSKKDTAAWNSDFRCPPEFREWLDTKVLTRDDVLQRTVSALGISKGIDYDHASVLGAIGNVDAAASVTSKESAGAGRVNPELYPNILVGILQHATSMSKNSHLLDKEMLRKDFSRQAGYFMTLNGILNNRIYTGKKYSMTKKYIEESHPRGGAAFDENMTVKNFMDESMSIYTAIPDLDKLFSFINEREGQGAEEAASKASGKEIREYLEKHYRHIFENHNIKLSYPSTLVELYAQIPDFISYYIDSKYGIVTPAKAEENLNKMIDAGKTVLANKEKRTNS